MDEEDAVTLLLSAVQSNTPTTQQIATEIVKAGAFISKSGNLSSYLELYTKQRALLLCEKPAQSHDSYTWTVYTTWQMSFDRLKPLAQMLLQLCSYLHYKGISEEFFSNASKYKVDLEEEEELQKPLEFLSNFLTPAGEWDSLRFLDVTNEIRAYSLVDFDDEKKMFSIHPLVHAWSKEIVSDLESIQSTVKAMVGMAISEIWEQDFQLASMVLLPHVESILQTNSELPPYFATQYGQILFYAGKYKQAEKLYKEVIHRSKELLGDNHPDTLRAIGHSASTYSELGEFKKAQELGIVVLEKCKQFLGDNHPETLNALGNVAFTYSELGEFKKAQELEIVVLEKQKQLLGDNHPYTLNAMNNLATTYGHLGEFKKAQELEIIALEKRKQSMGDNHPGTLRAMTCLACTYLGLGEFKKAQELVTVVFKKRKQFLGDNHPETLRAMNNLATTYSELGDFKTAQELGIVVLEKQKQFLGDDHPDTLKAMANLANTYCNLREFTKAEELELYVLQNHRQTLGDNHPDTLHATENLSITYQSQDKLQEEEELRRLFGLPTGSHSGALFKWPVKWLKKVLMGRDG